MLGLSGGSNKSSNESNVWEQQAPFLQDLYSQASNWMSNPQQQQLTQQGLDAGQQGANSMGGINNKTMAPWQQMLQGGAISNLGLGNFYQNMMAGQGTAMDTLTGLQNPQGNPYLEQMGQYGLDQLGENYQRNVMPSINANAAFTGGLGGSRQGIAQGLAADSFNNESANYLSNFYGSQYQADQNRAAQAAQVMGGLQGTAAQGYGNMLGQQDTNALNALGFSPQMLANQMAPANAYTSTANAGWNPYTQYASILGNPTVLGEGSSSGWNANLGYKA